MTKYLQFIPTYTANTIYDIDFSKLYALGKRIILTDLDNTLISYHNHSADQKLITFNHTLKEIGFQIYIVSNNNDKRIKLFSETFKIDGYLVKAGKPKAKKMNLFIEEKNFLKEEIIFIGDQLVTDIASANNARIDSILVSTIDVESQKWYTKINRLREKKIIKQINKFDSVTAHNLTNIIRKEKNHE